ncbi:MAG: hypothetical protein HKN04_10965 [Rhodothermaceae bacterium]|nr:hypothetical protein [Rhodothermaceae bacterium]
MPTTSGPSSPGEAFERAKDAMARGDWNAFYATLDQQDLLTLLRNGLTSVVSHGHVDEAFREVCAHAGYPLDSVEDALTQMGVAVQSGEDVQVWAKEYRARMDRGFRVVADLPVFAAEVERHFRR